MRGGIRLDIVFEEESITISKSIHIVAFDKPSLKPYIQDIPTQDNLVVHEEQTQDPNEPMFQEPIHLQRSMRQEKCYSRWLCGFLQEDEKNNGMMKDYLINFHQAM